MHSPPDSIDIGVDGLSLPQPVSMLMCEFVKYGSKELSKIF